MRKIILILIIGIVSFAIFSNLAHAERTGSTNPDDYLFLHFANGTSITDMAGGKGTLDSDDATFTSIESGEASNIDRSAHPGAWIWIPESSVSSGNITWEADFRVPNTADWDLFVVFDDTNSSSDWNASVSTACRMSIHQDHQSPSAAAYNNGTWHTFKFENGSDIIAASWYTFVSTYDITADKCYYAVYEGDTLRNRTLAVNSPSTITSVKAAGIWAGGDSFERDIDNISIYLGNGVTGGKPQAPPPTIYANDTDLIGYYKLDDASGTHYIDSKTNSLTKIGLGVGTGNPTEQTPPLKSFSSKSIDFISGTSAAWNDSTTTINILKSTNNVAGITIGAFVNLSNVSNGGKYVFGYSDAQGTDRSGVGIIECGGGGCSDIPGGTGATWGCDLAKGGTISGILSNTGISPTAGKTVSVVCRINSSDYTIFVDGIQQGTNADSTSIDYNTNPPLWMGMNHWNGQFREGIDGQVDEAFIINRSLTDAEILEYNNSGISPAELTSETEGDDAIVWGIGNSSISGATITSNQQIYVRKLNGSQASGKFDKFAIFGDQRWAFNYVTTNDPTSDLTNVFNITPTLHVLELQAKTQAQIQDEISLFINNTKT